MGACRQSVPGHVQHCPLGQHRACHHAGGKSTPSRAEEIVPNVVRPLTRYLVSAHLGSGHLVRPAYAQSGRAWNYRPSFQQAQDGLAASSPGVPRECFWCECACACVCLRVSLCQVLRWENMKDAEEQDEAGSAVSRTDLEP